MRSLQGVWGLILLGLVVTALRAPTIPGTYDQELDNLLYGGQRLLHGQWLYLDLYTGAPPLAQILYAPSAWLGSIRAHRLLVLFLNLLGGWLLCRNLRRAGRLELIRLSDRSPVPWLGGALFITFSQIFPAGLSGHLHQFTNLFLVLALDLAVTVGLRLRGRSALPSPAGAAASPWPWPQLAGIGFVLVLVACSSLMRSSLLVLMVLLLVLVPCRRRRSLILPMLLGACLALVLLFLPYLLRSGGAAQAWSGAVLVPLEVSNLFQPDDGRLIALPLRWLSTQAGGLQVWTLLLVPLVGIARLLSHQARHRTPEGERLLLIPALALVFILELLLAFQKADLDSHHLLLTITPLVLLLCCGLSALEGSPQRWTQVLATGMVLGLSLVYLNNVFVVAISRAPRISQELQAIEADRERVRAHLLREASPSMPLASAQDVALLRQLDQPSATVGIGPDWSLNQQNLQTSGATTTLNLPTTVAASCTQLTADPTRHLVWLGNDADGPNGLKVLQDCLRRDGTGWHDLSATLGLNSGRYQLWARSGPARTVHSMGAKVSEAEKPERPDPAVASSTP